MCSRRQNYLPTSLHMRTSALTSPERITAGNGVKLQIITNEQLLLHRGLKRIPYSRIGQSQAERGKKWLPSLAEYCLELPCCLFAFFWNNVHWIICQLNYVMILIFSSEKTTLHFIQWPLRSALKSDLRLYIFQNSFVSSIFPSSSCMFCLAWNDWGADSLGNEKT